MNSYSFSAVDGIIALEEANMEFTPAKDREIVIDIDRFIDTSREVGAPSPADENLGNVVSIAVCGGENCGNPKNVDEISPGTGKNVRREKGKKKPSKPPRPPRGLSLDAADQKLIKEISELAMLKRAKIERMKALKRMRAAKASSSSASSGGNLMAILFTFIFCAVIILQGRLRDGSFFPMSFVFSCKFYTLCYEHAVFIL